MSNGDYSQQLISLWSYLAAAVDSCFLILLGLQYDIIFGAPKTSSIEYLQGITSEDKNRRQISDATALVADGVKDKHSREDSQHAS